MKKEFYLAPDAEIFEMSLETGILAASTLHGDGQVPDLKDEEDWSKIW